MKDVKNFEGLYAVTSCGKVWSYKSKKFLKQAITKQGYLQVCLYKDGKQKVCLVHRLIAEAYIPNPENKSDVNHKNEFEKTNNSINNLEWLTRAENRNYGTRNTRAAKSCCKPVYCIELNRAFNSIKEAASELNLYDTNISAVLKGRQKTTGGYHWKYLN